MWYCCFCFVSGLDAFEVTWYNETLAENYSLTLFVNPHIVVYNASYMYNETREDCHINYTAMAVVTISCPDLVNGTSYILKVQGSVHMDGNSKSTLTISHAFTLEGQRPSNSTLLSKYMLQVGRVHCFTMFLWPVYILYKMMLFTYYS